MKMANCQISCPHECSFLTYGSILSKKKEERKEERKKERKKERKTHQVCSSLFSNPWSCTPSLIITMLVIVAHGNLERILLKH